MFIGEIMRQIFYNNLNNSAISKKLELFQNLKCAIADILSILQMYLMIPVTNVLGERLCSTLQPIKNYLKSISNEENLGTHS